VKWWRRAAEQGNTEAQFQLGDAHRTGRGIERNDTEAAQWFRLAAESGDPTAQNNLGSAYLNGCGVLQDQEEAMKWYRLAADQGDPGGQYNLAALYAEGGDHELALKLYKLSARQGFGLACFRLGQMYLTAQGVSQNYVDAYAWSWLAVSYRHTEAVPILEEISKRLDDADLARAEDKIREWRWKPRDDDFLSRARPAE
jgi:TPR repeat protein